MHTWQYWDGSYARDGPDNDDLGSGRDFNPRVDQIQALVDLQQRLYKYTNYILIPWHA